jgi:hypothetical protein
MLDDKTETAAGAAESRCPVRCEDNPPFEYFNCHPLIGLLPYAEAFKA